MTKFQFPSNGKAYINVTLRTTNGDAFSNIFLVSIPFKRESIYQHTDRAAGSSLVSCFNSLQTGKHISTNPMAWSLATICL